MDQKGKFRYKRFNSFLPNERCILQIVNHGMPREVMRVMKEAAAEFFDLPLEEKNKFSMPSDDIQGYGHAYVVSEDQKLDWSDTLILIIYPNQFRRHKYWPTTPEHFRSLPDLPFSCVKVNEETFLS